jgi:hypothetical protein
MDVVITFHPKDSDTLENCLFGLINNVKNVRNIYLVTSDEPNISGYENLFWIPENKYPFTHQDVKDVLNLCEREKNRTGWYYQQVLKLYTHIVIPTLSEYFLILDSDLIFTKPIQFFYNGKPAYTYGHEPLLKCYLDQVFKVLPNLDMNKIKYAGIAHHMIFNKTILNELYELVEKIHQMDFWKAFLKCRSSDESCGCSEYELYFHYINQYHSNEIYLRKLTMTESNTVKIINFDYDMVGCHSYLR